MDDTVVNYGPCLTHTNDEWMIVNCVLSIIINHNNIRYVNHPLVFNQSAVDFNGSAQFVDISWSSFHVVFSIVASNPWYFSEHADKK